MVDASRSHRPWANVLYWAIGLVAAIWAITWINGKRDVAAIWRVINEENRISEGLKGGDSPPMARALALEGIDTSGCPADFREAYRRRVATLKALASVPQSQTEWFAQMFANYFSGQPDGGLIRQTLDIKRLIDECESARLAVRASAIRHGALNKGAALDGP